MSPLPPLILALSDWLDWVAVLGAVAAVVVAGVLVWVQRSAGRVMATARRLASGDLTARASPSGPMRDLAVSLNTMAVQLGERVEAVGRQRGELGAVLSSMVEGVLAVDLDERVLSLNRAAAGMLAVEPGLAMGRTIQEVVRNSALQGLLARVLREGEPCQAETTLRIAERQNRPRTGSPDDAGARGEGAGMGDAPPREVRVQAQAAPLRDAADQRLGAVLVLHDVTRLRRLEQVRQDFVANVSHEVRTPVAAITAAVETLQDDPPEAAEDAARFLAIIARQARRIHAIVEDLLSLARLDAMERGREGEGDGSAASSNLGFDFEPMLLAPVLRAAAELCRPAAEAKRISIHVDCPAPLTARINHQLLEQAMLNLIDNAVKYSGEGTQIDIAATARGDTMTLCVHDRGRGIEVEHLPRVFERFYRTDRARSRAVGGTGLGLSIVKHVAEAHGGRVSVESTLGRGSTFRIHLPAEKQATDAHR